MAQPTHCARCKSRLWDRAQAEEAAADYARAAEVEAMERELASAEAAHVDREITRELAGE